jgi:hypothetical protein
MRAATVVYVLTRSVGAGLDPPAFQPGVSE